jgi:hypothetical protein
VGRRTGSWRFGRDRKRKKGGQHLKNILFECAFAHTTLCDGCCEVWSSFRGETGLLVRGVG